MTTADTFKPMIERVLIVLLTCLVVSCSPESKFEAIPVPSDHKWPPPGWAQQNPRTMEAMNAAEFITSRTGWIVGTHGAILATTDGGATWHEQLSGTDRHLSAVTFMDEQHGWIVGEGATILRTDDGGKTWTAQSNFIGIDRKTTPLEYIMLGEVAFTDASNGWVTGSGWVGSPDRGYGERSQGFVLVTSDGGRTWNAEEWAKDRGFLRKPLNGKARWFVPQPLPTGSLADVAFLDDLQGWAAGTNGVVYATKDGGKTWASQFQSSRSLTKGCFANAFSGWVIGEYGVIFHTVDGGATWQPQVSEVSSTLRGLECVDEKTAWVLGQYGTVLKTNDGGDHWIPQFNSTTQTLHGVFFINGTTGWAVGGNGNIVATTDGGNHWLRQATPTDNGLTAVAFASITHGWAVGEKGTILATKDGGATWQKQPSGIGEAFNGVSFVSPQQGWVVGTHGTILTTNDGGANWQILNRGGGSQPFPDWNNFFAVTFLNANTGWAVGHNGMIMATRDGGQSWEEQYGYGKQGNVGFLSDVSFPTSKAGWAVGWQMLGGKSVIMATTNGGKTWDFQNGASVHAGHDGILRGVEFIDSKTGWVVGGQGAILKTTNGGRTWTARIPKVEGTSHRYDFVYGPELYDAAFIDAKTGWVVGENGTILKTVTGGE